MTLLDAYALIAMVTGARAEHEVRAILDTGTAAIATLNLAEALDVLERVHGVAREDVDAIITPLLGAVIRVLPVGLETARRAAAIRAEHYHARTRRLSMADCVLIASAGEGDSVATADSDVLAVAPLLGLEPVELPGEAG